MTSWYDRNADRYDRDETGLAGEVEFYVALGRASPPVLELGCGTGRVTLALARAGVAVVGLDRSSAMLAVARQKALPADPVRWVAADMRGFALPERFGLICIPFRGFLQLLTDVDQRASLARCYEHLRPGGYLALNLFNPEIALRAARTAASNDIGRRRRAGRHDDKHGAGAVIGRSRFGIPIRYVAIEEMRTLLRTSGFVIEALWGGFDRQPITPDSSEQVWLARRPA